MLQLQPLRPKGGKRQRLAVPAGVGSYEQTEDDTEDDVIELGRMETKEKEKPHKRSRFSLHHAPSKELSVPKPTYEVP